LATAKLGGILFEIKPFRNREPASPQETRKMKESMLMPTLFNFVNLLCAVLISGPLDM
jgi:hypothetical protein